MSFKDYYSEAGIDIKQDALPEISQFSGQDLHYSEIVDGLNIIKGMFEDSEGNIPKELESKLVPVLKKDYQKTRRQFKSLKNKHFNYVFTSKVSEVFGPRIASLLQN